LALSLAFELERGGEPDAQDEQPTVWRVDEPLRSADLQRRFGADWSHWYGPVLVPHAAAIAALLADEAALALRLGGLPGTEHPRVWGGPLLQPDREQRFCSVPLPMWWALPVVRKRSRRLRFQLRGVDGAGLLHQLQPVLTPEWRGQPPLSLRLEFETRMYWGAQAEPDNTPGGVRWLPCRVRSDGLACSAPIAWPRWTASTAADTADEAQPAIERRLRGGIGLLLVLPLLVLERMPTASTSRLRQRLQQLQQLPQRLVRQPRQPHEPGLASRWALDEAWWARSLPTARLSDGALARALKRGAQLQPASLPALRRAGPDRPAEHVLLLHGQQQSVRSAFAAAVVGDPAFLAAGAAVPSTSVGAIWPGLPLLDTVATWRFEHDPWQALEANVAVLAAAIKRRIVSPRGGGPATAGGRLVLLAHGQGGLLARLLMQAWREPWAAQGWRLEAITLGTPHLGQPLRQPDDAFAEGCRPPPMVGALDAAAFAAAEVDRAALAERLRLSRWLAGEPPHGLADAQPQALSQLLGGDLARLPRGMWLLGSVWGAQPVAGHPSPAALRPAWLADEPAQSPASGDGAVALESALAGRRPWQGQAGTQAPPEDGVLAFDVSPARHGDYLALPPVRQLVSRGLAHLLGREGSWA
jgi:hypothetical protein